MDSTPSLSPQEQQEWLRQWHAAAVALKEVKAAELRAMTDQEALAASEALLSLAQSSYVAPWREKWSGLVEQQRVLHCRGKVV